MNKNVVLLAVMLAILMPAVSYSEEERENDAKLNTIGVSFGSTINPIPFILTIHGTFAPIKNSFLELGMDVGWGIYGGDYHNNHPDHDDNDEYFSMYPFANYAFFLPFPRMKSGKRIGGWYAGAGLGVIFKNWTFYDVGSIWDTAFAVNIITGINLWFIDISYTFTTDFNNYIHKLSIGYVYRFK